MPKSPQTNGICERFYRTVLDEFDRVAFRKEIYRTINERQTGLDAWITEYNEQRPHQGRWCFGKTPMQTFLERATTGQGKTHGSMTTDDSHIGSNNQHRPSDQVSANTDQNSDVRALDTERPALSSTYRSTVADKDATAPQIAAQSPSDKSKVMTNDAPMSGRPYGARFSIGWAGSLRSFAV